MSDDAPGEAPSEQNQSWWDRATDTKALVVTAIGVAVGVIALVLTLATAGRNSDPAGNESRNPSAPVGEQEIPPSVPRGPEDFLVPGHLNEPFTLPVDPALGSPRATTEVQRRWCSENLCQFDVDFNGATRPADLQTAEANATFYAVEVFPDPDEGPAVYAASGSNYDGTGGVVVDVPFLQGWFCIRLAAAYGSSSTQDLDVRSEWSEAVCVHLDADGYVDDVERLA